MTDYTNEIPRAAVEMPADYFRAVQIRAVIGAVFVEAWHAGAQARARGVLVKVTACVIEDGVELATADRRVMLARQNDTVALRAGPVLSVGYLRDVAFFPLPEGRDWNPNDHAAALVRLALRNLLGT